MRVECYDLRLYCDNKDVKHPYKSMPHEFTGPNKQSCYRQARGYGWRLGKKDLCPDCNVTARQP